MNYSVSIFTAGVCGDSGIKARNHWVWGRGVSGAVMVWYHLGGSIVFVYRDYQTGLMAWTGPFYLCIGIR